MLGLTSAMVQIQVMGLTLCVKEMLKVMSISNLPFSGPRIARRPGTITG